MMKPFSYKANSLLILPTPLGLYNVCFFPLLSSFNEGERQSQDDLVSLDQPFHN